MLVYIEDIWKDTQDIGMSNDLWGLGKEGGKVRKETYFFSVQTLLCLYTKNTSC